MMSKDNIPNILLLILSFAVLFLALELILRFNPGLFGQGIKNQILTKYYPGKEGIYTYNYKTGMTYMKPNQNISMYYNDYVWNHKTDSQGFRNLHEHNNVNVFLLGDSFIYGHGVNNTQTINYFIENLSNLSVVNLARQGDTIFQQRMLLNEYRETYNPEYVFLFFFMNDVEDLKYYVTEKEMNYYIKEQNYSDFTHHKLGISKFDIQVFIYSFLSKTYTGRSFYYQMKQSFIKNNLFSKNENNIFQTESNIQEETSAFDFPLEWQYIQKSICQMNSMTDQINASLIIVPLSDMPDQLEKINEVSSSCNVALISVQNLMRNKDYYSLKNDGHFNEKGHLYLAKTIIKFVSN